MCCFSRAVDQVSATRIYARALPDGLQRLVYQMSFRAAGELAMILPLPVPAGCAEDAVVFEDLSGYAHFFADLARAFPPPPAARSYGGPFQPQPSRGPAPLVVHDVGDFEASFVPSVSDFARLDPRFRLPSDVWDGLPAYSDWGFAVFKLREVKRGLFAALLPNRGATERGVHPMAFRFPRRDPTSLFFPTLHIHDGAAHPTAHFDHTLYAQPARDSATPPSWAHTDAEAMRRCVTGPGADTLVDLAAPCFRCELHGVLPNRDVTLPA
jgi:hypothetical protein